MEITRPDYYKEFPVLQVPVPTPAVPAGRSSLTTKA